MVSKLVKTEHGLAILLPPESLEILGVTPDSELSVTLNPARSQIIITPAALSLPEVDEAFARQVSDFIEQYRPTLVALAQ